MTDWTALLAQAGLDKDTLKEQLPLEYVAQQLGLQLYPQPDGRLTGLCPFHADSTPSFAIFGDRQERAGCWSCDFSSGDLFDLLMRMEGVDFAGAVRRATALLEKLKVDGFTPSAPPPVRVTTLDLSARARQAWEAAEADLTAVRRLCVAKGLTPPAEWLHREFHLGVEDDVTVLIPHLRREGDSWVVGGLKARTGQTHPYAAAGSQLSALYGAWRDDGQRPVVLCEGESDTWEMAWRLRDTHSVLGLPSGAAAAPREEWLQALTGRDVVLLFDSDAAGRKAALRWHRALGGARVARLEDGADALTAADPVGAVRRAVDVPPTTGIVVASPRGYIRVSDKGEGALLSNWTLRPSRLIEMEEGGAAIEGVLPDGCETLIRDVDLASESATIAWANERGYVYIGSKRDAQGILDLLLLDRPFLPIGHGTSVAGWHRGHFVLPGQSIGPERWLYVPPPADPRLDQRITIAPGPWDPDALRVLPYLQAPGAITPLLAWVAAAPLRALVPVFPPLAVVGSSGSGKTTLVEQVLKVFGWGVNLTLTGTTPHAVLTYASSTNGVPVWYDEYRPGARRDARETLDQVLRDAWSGQATVKGGLDRANYQRLTSLPVTAPILVSGEDALQETSHVERVQVVELLRRERRSEPLDFLQQAEYRGIGHAYLTWLVETWHAGTLPAPRLPRSGDRPAIGRAVLEWGWELLSGFAAVVNVDLGALELEGVTRAAEEAAALSPILDAISWAVDRLSDDGRPVAWVDGGDVWVRVRELIRLVKTQSDLVLPGGEKAVSRWLGERWPGASPERVRLLGSQVRAVRLPGAVTEVEEAV